MIGTSLLIGVHFLQQGGAWVDVALPSPLLALPNVTAHPSTATRPVYQLKLHII